MKCQTDEKTYWLIAKVASWWTCKMTSRQNDKLMKLQDDK